MEQQIRRQPSVEKQIKALTNEDVRVAISGLVVSKNETSFVIDDGTGQIPVSIQDPEEIKKVNGYIRVFGRLIPFEEGFELQGELIQDFSKIDKTLYKKVKELL